MKPQLHPPRRATPATHLSSTLRRTLLTAGIAGLLLPGADASILLEESFNYAVGPLAGSGLWTNAAVPITVAIGSLTCSDLAPLSPAGNAGRVTSNTGSSSAVFTQRPFETRATSGTVYASALVDFTGFGANITLMGMLPSAITTPGTAANDPCDFSFLPVTPGNSADGFKLGIRAKGGAAVYASSVLHLNSINLIVMKYDFGTKTASLFLNPTPGGSEPAPNASQTSTTAAVADMSVFFLRAAANTSTTPTFLIDDLRVGTTWADVTPLVVPEPSVLSLTLLGAACWAYQRRRN